MKTKNDYMRIAKKYGKQGYKSQKEFAEQAMEKQELRRERQDINDPLQLSFRERTALRHAVYIERVEHSIRENYRGSSSRWAGGLTIIWVEVDPSDIHARGDSEREWSRNGKWSGTNARLYAHVSTPQFNHMIECGGLTNLRCVPVEKSNRMVVYAATWIVQGRGFALNTQSGWIAVRRNVEYHSTTSAEAAKKGLEKKLKGQITQIERTFTLSELKAPIGVRDARSAGLCMPGIKKFLNKHQLPTTGHVFQVVRALRNEKRTPIRLDALQAIAYALKESMAA